MKQIMRMLQHTDRGHCRLSVSSLRDLGGVLSVLLRRLKSTVNKVSSLRDLNAIMNYELKPQNLKLETRNFMKIENLFKCFVAAAMLLGTTWAANAQTWNIGNPTAENVTATLSDGTLTISGTGAMQNWYGAAPAPWYNDRTAITSVVIEDGVTTIGYYAFYWCTGLTSVNIPNSVASIGNYAFEYCTRLTSVSIPNSVTSIG
ncbi:MAG: leucine-rich repeat domain-containing protein, partial [Bacteroidales bacterium]|nr:leucine-rich repeat domain-containing protein [Bacteroidales bacterium]